MNRNFPAIALACFLIGCVGLNVDVVFDDYESTWFGFPFPWNARSPAASLVKELFILPALIDFFLLFVLARLLLDASDRLGAAKALIVKRSSFVLGVFGLAVLAVTFMFNDTFFSYWPDSWPNSVHSVRIGLGA